MYSEKIKYLSYGSDENTHFNKIRNAYFENRNCMTNVLNFLDQEVVIMPANYFSYAEGSTHMIEDGYINLETDRHYSVEDSLERIGHMKGYHLSVLDNYLTIVANNMRCIFTNKDMEEGTIIGAIIWVKNYNEILKKFSDRNLKLISKAIVHPHILNHLCPCHIERECLDEDFLLFMDIYYPEIVFKYSIDSYMPNICIEVYNKLAEGGLNGLVDKYIASYKQCDGYEKLSEENRLRILCKCGRLRAFCYLDL